MLEGASVEDLLKSYPNLQASQIYVALAYLSVVTANRKYLTLCEKQLYCTNDIRGLNEI